MTIGKTVYILGAGASASAKVPTQAKLLEVVFSIFPDNFTKEGLEKDFLSMQVISFPTHLQSFYSVFDKYRRDIGSFIVSNFSTSDKLSEYSIALKKVEELEKDEDGLSFDKYIYLRKAYEIVRTVKVTLEDLFTIFDNVAAGREHFKTFSYQEMDLLHKELKQCIIYTLVFATSTSENIEDYEKFSQHLIRKRLSNKLADDNLSVITLNWDDLLERALFKSCNSHNLYTKKRSASILPDLCFYDHDYDMSKKHIPSVNIKAKGIRNVKILKMHGSLAWLECPRCGRIFSSFVREIAYDEFDNATCPCCEPAYYEEDSPKLRSLIITPTFLKSLENLNIKNIWQNALIDISEADHIVFIGYSFPDADFEMRCLLKKAVKGNAEITVVLSEYDNPEYYRKKLKGCGSVSEDLVNDIIRKLELPEYRYQSFFGEGRAKFDYDGFSKFVDKIGESK